MKNVWWMLVVCPAILCFALSDAHAETVILENGRVLKNAKVDLSGDTAHIAYNGASFSIAKSRVKEVKPDDPKPIQALHVTPTLVSAPKPASTAPAKLDLNDREAVRVYLKECRNQVENETKDNCDLFDPAYVGDVYMIQDGWNDRDSGKPYVLEQMKKIKASAGFWRYLKARDQGLHDRLKMIVAKVETGAQASVKAKEEQSKHEAHEQELSKQINADRFLEISHEGNLPALPEMIKEDPCLAFMLDRDLGYTWVRENKSMPMTLNKSVQHAALVDAAAQCTDPRFEWCQTLSGRLKYSPWVLPQQKVMLEFYLQAYVPNIGRVQAVKSGGIVQVQNGHYSITGPNEVNAVYSKWCSQASDARYYHPLHMHMTQMDHSHFSLPPEPNFHSHDEPALANDRPRPIASLKNDPTYIQHWEHVRRQQEEEERQQRLEETLERDRQEKARILEEDRIERENAVRRLEERLQH